MITSPQEVMTVLRQYNPWWSRQPVVDLPEWRRAAFRELDFWLRTSPAPRAVLMACYWLGQSELLSTRRKAEED
jgi:hypothetical protein